MKNVLVALTLMLASSGCFAVLELDAEPGDGETEEEGGGGSVGQTVGGAPTGGAPPFVTVTTTTGGGNQGGSYECTDPSVVFDGSELITLDDADHNVLDLDDKVAIGAWVWPAAAEGEQYVFSRFNAEIKKGFGLLVRATEGGALVPELRVYVKGQLCGCSGGPIPVGAWSHVSARFVLDHVDSKDAAVWVNGERVCIAECGSEKFQRFPAKPVIGGPLVGQAGYFRGRLDDVYVMSSDEEDAPPMLEGDQCFEDVELLLSFDTAIVEGGLASCAPGLSVTLGRDAFAGSDEPTWESCQ